MTTLKTVAIIPVRGGSKSIPLKNIKLINGRPLLYWTIDAAISCSYIDAVYISTDSVEIEQAVANYDGLSNMHKLNCIGRHESTATDFATTESVLLDFIERVSCDRLILLQATSPLTETVHLTEAFELYERGDFDSLLSVVEQKRFTWTINKEGVGVPVNYHPAARPRRQDYTGYLVENGAFYITMTKALIQSQTRISGKIGLYTMPEETYYEIDEPSDWIIVEQLLKRRNSQKATLDERLKRIKLFATDCDGVLTDAGMYYTDTGDAMKKFNTKDGLGLALLRQQGIKTAILTGENSQIVARRAEKLAIDDVYLGCSDKVEAMLQLLKKYNLSFEEIAFIGDDLNDLQLLQRVGVSFSVADAMEAVKNQVDYVTQRGGGQGAVREAIEYILAAKG